MSWKRKPIKKIKISIESMNKKNEDLSNELDLLTDALDTKGNVFNLMKSVTQKVDEVKKFTSDDSFVANCFVSLVDDTISSENTEEKVLENADSWDTYRSTIQSIYQGKKPSLAIEKLNKIYPESELDKKTVQAVNAQTDSLLESLESVEGKGNLFSEFINNLELLDPSGELRIKVFNAFSYLNYIL